MVVTLTDEEAKLCLEALLVYPCDHRSPYAALTTKLAERIQPGTTFRGDPRHVLVEKKERAHE